MTPKISLVAVCCSSDSGELLEQPHVLDRDHGLVGEGLDQLYLPLCEWFDKVTPNCDCSDACSFSQ